MSSLAFQIHLLPADQLPKKDARIVYVNGRAIRGTVNKSRKCNDACLMAKSDRCHCECGGINHGAKRGGF